MEQVVSFILIVYAESTLNIILLFSVIIMKIILVLEIVDFHQQNLFLNEAAESYFLRIS